RGGERFREPVPRAAAVGHRRHRAACRRTGQADGGAARQGARVMAELTAQQVKEAGLAAGLDAVGIANIERLKDAPEQMQVANIFPECESVIMTLRRIPRGVYRGIEEGTHWSNYTFYGYNRLNSFFRPLGTYRLACFIEDHGWEAVPVYPG